MDIKDTRTYKDLMAMTLKAAKEASIEVVGYDVYKPKLVKHNKKLPTNYRADKRRVKRAIELRGKVK